MAADTLSSEELIKQYADGIIHLSEAIAGLSGTELDTALDDNHWTIRQIVHHVADGDELWKTCIKSAFGSNEPFNMNWYWDISQDNWVELWHYAKRDVEPSLALLQANREHIIQLLTVIPNALEQDITVNWPEGQQKGAVRDVIKMQVGHLTEHIAEIHAIRQKHGFA